MASQSRAFPTDPKKAKKQANAAAVAKFSVPIPDEVHRALALASLDTGRSISSLVVDIVEAVFPARAQRSRLRLLDPPARKHEWKRISVFLPIELKLRATNEVHRQHGNNENKRFTGSLASAIAALIADRYLPSYKF